MRFMTILIMLLASFAVSFKAQAAESAWLEHDFVKMRLISASETIGETTGQTAGETTGESGTLSLGLEMQLKEGWKTYWRTPGDAGLPTQIFVDPIAMAGTKTQLHYPTPKRFSLFGLDTFGYGGRVILPLDMRLGAAFQAQNIALTVEALVCADICVPVQGPLSLSLEKGPLRPSIYSQELAKIRALLPKQTDNFATLSLADRTQDQEGQGHLLVTLNEPMAVEDILVEGLVGASFAAPEALSDRRYLLRLIGGQVKPQKGDNIVLTIDGADTDFEASATIGQVSSVSDLEPVTEAAPSLPFWLIAFLGGVILNFMPCVLPVLSLKLASLISMGGQRPAYVRVRFLTSAAGIISSFVLIAVFLHALRMLGGQVGWGIQFQSPLFLGALLLITGLFTLSLFEIVQLRTPAFVRAFLPRRTTPSDAPDRPRELAGDFGAGMLATILATPCSAPFVGTAISFALSQSNAVLYGMLIMMGFGLALPWLLVALAPQMLRFLPKPGAWMGRLQKALGVLMALTVLWVGSLFFNAISSPQIGEDEAGWARFDKAVLASHSAEDKTIFVDVTADWCITCKANKTLVLDTKAARALFDAYDVILLRADWTHPDEAIADYLAANGRFGIPFNIVYGPAAKAGIALPEILTINTLKNALEAANR